MATIEERLQEIEDRQALEDLLHAYTGAVDSLSDIDGLLACFTENAVFDLSGIHLPRFDGHAGIRGFFQQVFKDMSHHAHFVANFGIDSISAQEATTRAYVMGMGRAHDGNEVLVYVRYRLDCVRAPGGWKIAAFSEGPLMPLPKSLTDIHGRD
jgi:ketosteroid isomerase-like protein